MASFDDVWVCVSVGETWLVGWLVDVCVSFGRVPSRFVVGRLSKPKQIDNIGRLSKPEFHCVSLLIPSRLTTLAGYQNQSYIVFCC